MTFQSTKGVSVLHFHGSSVYLDRTSRAWCEMQRYALALQDLDAGYCLDAPERSPAGATVRVDQPQLTAPFACPELTWYRGD